MNLEQLQFLLEQVREGALPVEQAVDRLKFLPFEDLGFAKVDHHRALRHGLPEVILGQGKAPQHVAKIFERLQAKASNVLATRVSPEAASLTQQLVPDAEYFPLSRCLRVLRDTTDRGKGTIGIICAGTADIPVAEEAKVTAETFGNKVDFITDVGVAGIHRLLAQLDRLRTCRLLICVAGMEAALPSAVGGLVGCPVIGVPTSVGYGSHFHGLAALLGMLNSCASNVTVVNIDNGFGGAYVASLINRL
jgi:hypothetical protein